MKVEFTCWSCLWKNLCILKTIIFKNLPWKFFESRYHILFIFVFPVPRRGLPQKYVGCRIVCSEVCCPHPCPGSPFCLVEVPTGIPTCYPFGLWLCFLRTELYEEVTGVLLTVNSRSPFTSELRNAILVHSLSSLLFSVKPKLSSGCSLVVVVAWS